MKKIMTLCLTLLMLAAFVAPVAATPVDELTDLAQYAPADSFLFATVRTDAGFFETLDGVLQNTAEALPPGLLPPGFSVQAALDMLGQSAALDPNADFESALGWLGDSIALAVGSNDALPPTTFETQESGTYVLYSVSDQVGAADFVDNIVANDFAEYERSKLGNGTLWAPADPERYDWRPTYYLVEGALIQRTTSVDPQSIAQAFETNLAASERFTASLDALPGDDYNALVYNDFAGIIAPLLTMATEFGEMDATLADMLDSVTELIDILGPQVLGFTIVDGRSLTIDLGQTYTDLDALAGLGSPVVAGEPLSFGFTNSAPADTALYIQDTGFGTDIVNGFAALDMLSDFLEAQFPDAQFDLMSGQIDEEYLVYLLNDVLAFTRLTFQALTGESIEDAFGWMTGDYGIYAGVALFDMGISVDLGLLVENTDADEAAEFLTGTANLARELAGDPIVADDGTVTLTVVPDTLSILTGANADTFSVLDLLVGANEDVLALGLRPGVEAVLAGNGGLAETEAFTSAQAYFLPDTEILYYVAFEPFVGLVEQFAALDPSIGLVAQLIGLLESASITATVDTETGVANARFVITLAN